MLSLTTLFVIYCCSLFGHFVVGIQIPSTNTAAWDAALQATYDYIIVGGGTAGLTLANRLSTDPAYKVLVLEQGDSIGQSWMVDYPGCTGFDFNTAVDYAYITAPQSALNNRLDLWPQGKALGGSSAINGRMWTRPKTAELNAWESVGAKGWNWATLSPYFLAAESFTLPKSYNLNIAIPHNSASPGSSGPVLTRPLAVGTQLLALLQASKYLNATEISHANSLLNAKSPGKVLPSASVTQVESFFHSNMPLVEPLAINTAASYNSPKIDPGAMTHPYDAYILSLAPIFLRQILSGTSFSKWVKQVISPLPTITAASDVEYWVINNAGSMYHPVGTCGMIPESVGGVVDPNLKVYGTSNVRVVDASIFPLHVSGHLSSVVYAVALKAADIIIAAR